MRLSEATHTGGAARPEATPRLRTERLRREPIVSDKILRDAVVNEPERDPEVVTKHISVTAIDGPIAGHVVTNHEKHVAVRAAERHPAWTGRVGIDAALESPE